MECDISNRVFAHTLREKQRIGVPVAILSTVQGTSGLSGHAKMGPTTFSFEAKNWRSMDGLI